MAGKLNTAVNFIYQRRIPRARAVKGLGQDSTAGTW